MRIAILVTSALLGVVAFVFLCRAANLAHVEPSESEQVEFQSSEDHAEIEFEFGAEEQGEPHWFLMLPPPKELEYYCDYAFQVTRPDFDAYVCFNGLSEKQKKSWKYKIHKMSGPIEIRLIGDNGLSGVVAESVSISMMMQIDCMYVLKSGEVFWESDPSCKTGRLEFVNTETQETITVKVTASESFYSEEMIAERMEELRKEREAKELEAKELTPKD